MLNLSNQRSSLVHNVAFETGIVKIRKGVEDELTTNEKKAVSIFKLNVPVIAQAVEHEEVSNSVADRIASILKNSPMKDKKAVASTSA